MKEKLSSIILKPVVEIYKVLDYFVNGFIYKHILLRNHEFKIMTIEDSILELINSKKSIARFGDGEMKWVLGIKQNSFQEQSDNLANDLRKILITPQENCLIGLPPSLSYIDDYDFEAFRYWAKTYVRKGYKFFDYIDENRVYANADISRCYMAYKNKSDSSKYFSLIKKIWENRSLLIVEGSLTRLGVGNDLFDNTKNIRRILAPAKDAYNKIQEIFEVTKEYLEKDELVLIALGPTATVLAYNLAQEGIQAIDIGHIDIEYEWFKLGVKNKVAIKNKYTNEAGVQGRQVDECDSVDYLNQIIYKF